jgi:exosortase
MGILAGIGFSTFGTQIAREGMTEPMTANALTESLPPASRKPMFPGSPWSMRPAQLLWGSALIGTLVVAAYFHVLTNLVSTWMRDPDFSHGFLVPVFAAYLVWVKRESIFESDVALSWTGVAIVAAGLAALILGAYGASIFVARVSLVVVLTGLVQCFGGWQLVRALRFALLVLFLAIPLPAILFNQIALPLQFFTSKLASHLLPYFGVPVLRQGNIIELASIKLEVAEACSGIRSLETLSTLAILFGYFAERTLLRRTILALSSIPIAIAANAVRILGTGLCVEYWGPDKALGFFHEFSGWVMFVVSLGCLFVVHYFMRFVLAFRRRA